MAKIKAKSKGSGRILIREDWKGLIDQIEYDADEWDEWLEEPSAQGNGQGQVRIARVGMSRPKQYYPFGR